MGLIADTPAQRVEQLIAVTERLTALIAGETALIQRRAPLNDVEGAEKQRLANAYRLELARIKQDPELIRDAPAALLERLKDETDRLHRALERHEIELGAVKLVAEGLVQAMAEDVARQRQGPQTYGSRGGLAPSAAPASTLLDRSA
jgi:hypothetical protein